MTAHCKFALICVNGLGLSTLAVHHAMSVLPRKRTFAVPSHISASAAALVHGTVGRCFELATRPPFSSREERAAGSGRRAMPFRLGPFNLMDAQIVVRKFRDPIPRQLRLKRIGRRPLPTWGISGLQWFAFWTLVLGREIDSGCSCMLGLALRYELGDADCLR
jgi:hypothetical protein